ncbi:MAG: histidinol-phosphate transaminase [Spirochaetaceae bacterium]|jgi:histidinol-phosphate aminotransferase|nr:histidinol-phosphate transaminase [Spirochaetaceae bacterium]
MTTFWNTRTGDLKPYVPGEQPREEDCIKLNTNENPYPPSPTVIEAIGQAACATLRLYPDPHCTILREAIAEHYRVKIEQVFAGNGSDEILSYIFAAFFGREPVLVPDITYTFYAALAQLWDVQLKAIPLAPDFSLELADYKKPCGGIIFPNPNAPTGRSCALEALRSVADYQRTTVLVIDEAYGPFGSESAVPLCAEYPQMLTVHTLSKAYALAGLRVGFAIGSEQLIAGLCRVRDSFNSYTLDRLALAAASAALKDQAYYRTVIDRIIKTRERIAPLLRAQGWTVIPSQSNFLFISHPQRRGIEWQRFLREHKILVRHFNMPRISEFLRVTIGTDEQMDRFLDVISP